MSKDKTTALPFKIGETLSTTKDSIERSEDIIAGRYRILETIGKGGMGKIYRAEQLELGREVAIKVMLAPDDEISSKRFMLEASITASLNHPNTIRVFDFGKMDDQSLFLVMEYIDGINVKQSITQNGPFSPQQAMRLGAQLCGSLGEAHRKDLIHRDIKPGNIMLLESPEEGLLAKLLDFGLVKNIEQTADISQTGTILGSPMYMSPEQINGSEIDSRSDIYSLGLTMYYILCGNPPHKESNISGVLAAQLFKPPIPIIEQNPLLESCPALRWIIETATQKESSERFSSVLQMKKALELAQEDGRSSLKLVDGELFYKDQPVIGLATKSLQKTPPVVNTENTQDTLKQVSDDPELSSTMLNTQTMQIQLQRNNRILGLIGVIFLVMLTFLGWVVNDNRNQPSSETKQPVNTFVDILIETTPSGATVYQDSGLIGTTPFSHKIKDGENFLVEVSLTGYQSQTLKLLSSAPKRMLTLVPNKKEILSPSIEATKEPVQKKTPKKSANPKIKNEKEKISLDEIKNDDNNPFE
jgi:serine/threonine protein kinase